MFKLGPHAGVEDGVGGAGNQAAKQFGLNAFGQLDM